MVSETEQPRRRYDPSLLEAPAFHKLDQATKDELQDETDEVLDSAAAKLRESLEFRGIPWKQSYRDNMTLRLAIEVMFGVDVEMEIARNKGNLPPGPGSSPPEPDSASSSPFIKSPYGPGSIRSGRE